MIPFKKYNYFLDPDHNLITPDRSHCGMKKAMRLDIISTVRVIKLRKKPSILKPPLAATTLILITGSDFAIFRSSDEHLIEIWSNLRFRQFRWLRVSFSALGQKELYHLETTYLIESNENFPGVSFM